MTDDVDKVVEQADRREGFARQMNDLLTALLTERQEWDEPPSLTFAYQDEGEPLRTGGEIIPLAIWEAVERPPDVLIRFAETLPGSKAAKLLAQVAPDNVCALVFRCEMWTLRGDKNTPPEELEKAKEDSRRHVIHKRPDRIEGRFAMAATDDGLFAAQQIRGEEPKVDPIGEPGTTWEGTVPKSLLAMYKAIVHGE